MTESGYRCGFVAITGRPNVGKSTLINALVGAKVSIVSSKAQTTRFKTAGIHTTADAQFIYLDTPGLQYDFKRSLNRRMNSATAQAIEEADVILVVVEATHWTDDDERVLFKCMETMKPIVLAVNKIDKLKPRSKLIPFLDKLQSKAADSAIVPVSAVTSDNVREIEAVIQPLLPISIKLCPDGQVFMQDKRMQTAECIREKVMHYMKMEIPYSTAVHVTEYTIKNSILHVDATIWVERDGQKAIVIGSNGSMLKNIGRAARLDIERANNCKVYLRLHVKTVEHWTDDETALNNLEMAGEN